MNVVVLRERPVAQAARPHGPAARRQRALGGVPTPLWRCPLRVPRHAGASTAPPGKTALDSDDFDEEEHDPAPARQPERGEPRATAEGASAAAGSGTSGRPGTGEPGSGLFGAAVGAWMAAIGFLMRLFAPLTHLMALVPRPAMMAAALRRLSAQLPDGFWARLLFLWEQPLVKSVRITASVANWGVRLPAIAALLVAQGGLLASQVSLPMLAPLLLGTGMMVNTISRNASLILPRLAWLSVLLWLLWFCTSVAQRTWLVLHGQGRIDARTLGAARMLTEVSALTLGGILALSCLGLNINALLLPAGVVLAFASRDLLQNLIAGFYLVLAQPFRLGDVVAVCATPPLAGGVARPLDGGPGGPLSGGGTATAAAAAATGAAAAAAGGWFEGVCEKVDLRYTVLRDGRRRLMVPNTAFVSSSFLVYDDGPQDALRASRVRGAGAASPSPPPQQPSEPAIREGHIVTELPPGSGTLFAPGMLPVVPPPGGLGGAGGLGAPYPAYAAVPLPYGPPYGQPMHPDGSMYGPPYEPPPAPLYGPPYGQPMHPDGSLYGPPYEPPPPPFYGAPYGQPLHDELLEQAAAEQHADGGGAHHRGLPVDNSQPHRGSSAEQQAQALQPAPPAAGPHAEQVGGDADATDAHAAPTGTPGSQPARTTRGAKGPPGYLPQGLRAGAAFASYHAIPVYWPTLVPWGGGAAPAGTEQTPGAAQPSRPEAHGRNPQQQQAQQQQIQQQQQIRQQQQQHMQQKRQQQNQHQQQRQPQQRQPQQRQQPQRGKRQEVRADNTTMRGTMQQHGTHDVQLPGARHAAAAYSPLQPLPNATGDADVATGAAAHASDAPGGDAVGTSSDRTAATLPDASSQA